MAALLALTAIGAPHAPALAHPQAVVTYDSPIHFGGPFTLTDQDGHARRDTDFRGKLVIIYFGYTNCPDVCPLELQKMSDVMDLLGAKATDVQPVFITGDPQRDTAEHLKAFFRNFSPRFVALTGNGGQVRRAAKEFHVTFDRIGNADGTYYFDHTSIIFLMGRDGQHIDHFGTSFSARRIADEVEKHL